MILNASYDPNISDIASVDTNNTNGVLSVVFVSHSDDHGVSEGCEVVEYKPMITEKDVG